MSLLGVWENLAWFCNLDSQERLCELVEGPGFKSQGGKVSFAASHCLPSWHMKVPKKASKEERTDRSALRPQALLQHTKLGPDASGRGAAQGTVPSIRKGWILRSFLRTGV